MLVLTDPSHTQQIADPFIRQHCDMIFSECLSEDALLGRPYNAQEDGYLIVVEPGDSMEDLEAQTGIQLFTDLFTGVRYGDHEYQPCFEFIEKHSRKDRNGNICTFSTMLVITSDSGYGVEFVVPDTEGINACLASFIAKYAKPALSSTD